MTKASQFSFSNSPYSALIIGASGGIGAALVDALQSDPGCADVKTLSRSQGGVDVTDEATLAAAAEEAHASGAVFDVIINATGALEVGGTGPEKAFRELDPEAMTSAFRINSVGAALVLKHFAPLMNGEKRSVFATLSARVGSIGDNHLGGWMSYRASKAALNQIVRCAAIEIARTNKEAVVVALHPGTIETDLTRKYAKGRYTATPDECAQNLLTVLSSLPAKRTGCFFDYAGKEIPW